jgi:LysM repeat protein
MAEPSEPWAAPPRISWTARILGPLALIAVIIAFVVIISGSSDSGGDSDTTTKTERENKGEIPKTYVVQPGDSLTTIAEEFGISIKRIERLNPELDAQTLNEGQEIKLH